MWAAASWVLAAGLVRNEAVAVASTGLVSSGLPADQMTGEWKVRGPGERKMFEHKNLRSQPMDDRIATFGMGGTPLTILPGSVVYGTAEGPWVRIDEWRPGGTVQPEHLFGGHYMRADNLELVATVPSHAARMAAIAVAEADYRAATYEPGQRLVEDIQAFGKDFEALTPEERHDSRVQALLKELDEVAKGLGTPVRRDQERDTEGLLADAEKALADLRAARLEAFGKDEVGQGAKTKQGPLADLQALGKDFQAMGKDLEALTPQERQEPRLQGLLKELDEMVKRLES